MDLSEKLRILADAAKYDASCASSGSRRRRAPGGLGNTDGIGICHSYTPDGRCVSLLKLLLTNYCIFDCSYCVNRVSSDTRRARFSVDEVVRLTVEFYKRNYIEGLFLSSGIIQSADYTMEQLLQVARILREVWQFGGYIHLKAVPGCSKGLLTEAGHWVDRLSANVEMALDADLVQLAPAKSHAQIESAMEEMADGAKDAADRRTRSAGEPKFLPAGQSTQFVVGATGTPDAMFLKKSSELYQRYGLRRVYYSAFSPIPYPDPLLPSRQIPVVREHRLYQADWLMRFYGFSANELTTPENPNLSLEKDPKLSWALRHRSFFPVDVNRGERSALLRVPGFGFRNVERMLQVRRYRALTTADLTRLRVQWNKARFFVITADYNPDVLRLDQTVLPQLVDDGSRQLSLFEAMGTARTGEL